MTEEVEKDRDLRPAVESEGNAPDTESEVDERAAVKELAEMARQLVVGLLALPPELKWDSWCACMQNAERSLSLFHKKDRPS